MGKGPHHQDQWPELDAENQMVERKTNSHSCPLTPHVLCCLSTHTHTATLTHPYSQAQCTCTHTFKVSYNIYSQVLSYFSPQVN